MRKILLVEDDKLLGKSVKATLEDAGYTVLWATMGTEAFTALATGEVGLVYLDIMLPGDMDGYGILQQMKQIGSAYREIPVVMLSNLGQMEEIDRAMQLGAIDYVVKANIDLDQLVELTGKKIV